MNKALSIVSIVCGLFFVFGCEGKSTVNSQITDSVTQSVHPSEGSGGHGGASNQSSVSDQSTTGNSSDFPPHQDPLDQSSADYITYHPKGWSVAASSDWFVAKSKVPYTELTLVNPTRDMLFTLLSEATDKSADDYLASQQKFLQSLGIKDVTTEKVKINGIDYWRLDAPNTSYNNWQWITVSNRQAHVLGCGSPKGVKPSYETCLDLVLGSAQVSLY